MNQPVALATFRRGKDGRSEPPVRPERRTHLLAGGLLGAIVLLGCGSPRIELDAGAGCTSNNECPPDRVCVQGECLLVIDPDPPDAGAVTDGGADGGHDAGVPLDAGTDAGEEIDDGGWGLSCDDPFDAGPGPFTFDAGDGSKPDGAVPIQLLQDPDAGGRPPVNSEVLLYGVVSTTPRALISGFDGGVCTYGAWVSEPTGGPSSGIALIDYVFLADGGVSTGPGCPDGGNIPGDLQIGEALAVRGRYQEFCIECGAEPVAEIRVSGLDRLGTAPVPPPVVVTGADIGEGISPKPENNRRLEGTLVQLRNVEVVNENPDAPRYYRNFLVRTPGSNVSGQDSCFVHNAFGYPYRPRIGHRFQCITGPLTFGFGHYKIEPRTRADFVR